LLKMLKLLLLAGLVGATDAACDRSTLSKCLLANPAKMALSPPTCPNYRAVQRCYSDNDCCLSVDATSITTSAEKMVPSCSAPCVSALVAGATCTCNPHFAGPTCSVCSPAFPSVDIRAHPSCLTKSEEEKNTQCNPGALSTPTPVNPLTGVAGTSFKDNGASPYCNNNGVCNVAGNGCSCHVLGQLYGSKVATGSFTGAKCDKCSPGHYAYPSCAAVQPACTTLCTNHGACIKPTSDHVCYARGPGMPFQLGGRGPRAKTCTSKQTCCTPTVVNKNDPFGYDGQVQCCNADETCCNGSCCSGKQTCRDGTGADSIWTNKASVWVSGRVENGTVWNGLDSKFIEEGMTSAYCYDTPKGGEVPCGPTPLSSCKKGYTCSDDQYGICTKTGRTKCYPMFLNGSAAGIQMGSLPNGIQVAA